MCVKCDFQAPVCFSGCKLVMLVLIIVMNIQAQCHSCGQINLPVSQIMEKHRAGELLRFSEICRLCLHFNCHLLPLLDSDKKLPEKLTSLLPSLTVNRQDRLPSHICEKCVQRLDDAYEFKLQCEHSNIFLQKHIESQEFPVAQVNSDDEQRDELPQVEDELSISSSKTDFVGETCNENSKADKSISHTYCECKCTSKSVVNQNEESIHVNEEEISPIQSHNTSEFSKHSLTKHISLNYSCTSDEKSFKHSSSHTKHQDIHHQCSLCMMKFTSRQDMIMHVTNAHSQEAPHICHHCSMCFRDHEALLEHEKEHVCCMYNKSFNSHHKLQVLEHLHSESRLYSCLQCEKNFESDAALLNHTSESHSKNDSCNKERKGVSVVLQEQTSLFNCEKCNKTFSSHADYVSHTTNHSNQFSVGKLCKYKSKIHRGKLKVDKQESTNGADVNSQSNGQYSCEHCDKTFTCRTKYFAHVVSHSDARPFECLVCGKKFKYQSNLSNHKTLHVKTGPFVCVHCGRTFGNQSHLTKHSASHSEERPHQCSVCGKCFKHKSNLCNHKALHVENGSHLCTHCGKSFATKSILARHVAVHSGERPYRCPYCGKGFKHMSNMCNHKALHLQKSPFLCAVCGKSFSSRSNLTTHSAAHSEDRCHQCNICGKSFKFRSSLNSHVSLHSLDRPHLCKICGRSFRCRSTFVNHVRAHTGEKPHRCGICSKDFTTLSNLIVHRRVHSGEKPYTCMECGKAFSDRGNLSAHQAVHTPDRPHACPTCRQTFKYHSSMKRHIRKRHGGVGLPASAPKLLSVEKY